MNVNEFLSLAHKIGEGKYPPFQSIIVQKTLVDVYAHILPFFPVSPVSTTEPFSFSAMKNGLQNVNSQVSAFFNRRDFESTCQMVEVERGKSYIHVNVHAYGFQVFKMLTDDHYIVFVLVLKQSFFFRLFSLCINQMYELSLSLNICTLFFWGAGRGWSACVYKKKTDEFSFLKSGYPGYSFSSFFFFFSCFFFEPHVLTNDFSTTIQVSKKILSTK